MSDAPRTMTITVKDSSHVVKALRDLADMIEAGLYVHESGGMMVKGLGQERASVQADIVLVRKTSLT